MLRLLHILKTLSPLKLTLFSFFCFLSLIGDVQAQKFNSGGNSSVDQNAVDQAIKSNTSLESAAEQTAKPASSPSTVVHNVPEVTTFGKKIPNEWREAIAAAATKYNLDPYDIAARIDVESKWNPNVSSSVGAQGLGQFMPGTWEYITGLDASRRSDPIANIMATAKYMKMLEKQYGAGSDEAIAAYNTGGGNVNKAKKMCGVRWRQCLPAETRAYLYKITKAKKDLLQTNGDASLVYLLDSKLAEYEALGFGSASTFSASASVGHLSDTTSECLPRNYYMEMKDDCLMCPLFRVVFNTCSNLAYYSLITFSGHLGKVLLVAFGIWLALHTLKFVSTLTINSMKSYIPPILEKAFLVAIAFILLENGSRDFFTYALEPIFNTGMKLAQTTLSADRADNYLQAASQGIDTSSVQTVCTPDPNLVYYGNGGALPQSMGDNILCTMQMIQNRAAKIKALGNAAICYSWEKKAIIFPHISYLLTGIGLWIGGVLLILGVPFVMIDSVLQLAVASALIPFAVAAFPFKPTRKYTSKVWETFLNSMFVFIFVSLAALMLTIGFEQILVKNTSSLDALLSATGGVVIGQILEDIPWFSVAFLQVIFMTILTWSMLKESKNFGSGFAKTIYSGNIGEQIGTMGASFTKNTAVAAAQPVAEAAMTVGKDVASSSVRSVRNAGRRVLSRYQGNKIKSNAVRSQIDTKTGNVTYTDASGNQATYGGSANQLLSVKRSKQSKNRNGDVTTSTKTKTHDISITHIEVKNAAGEITKCRDILRYNSSAFRDLENYDGTVNEDVRQHILDNTPPEMKEDVEMAMAKELVKKRFGNLKFNMLRSDYVRQEKLRDESGQIIGYQETLSDGSTQTLKMTKGQNGRVLTELTIVEKSGRHTILKTDGILQNKSVYKVDATGAIDEKSRKDFFAVNKRYRYSDYKDNRFLDLKKDSFFEDEDFQKAEKAELNLYDPTGIDRDMYEFS